MCQFGTVPLSEYGHPLCTILRVARDMPVNDTECAGSAKFVPERHQLGLRQLGGPGKMNWNWHASCRGPGNEKREITTMTTYSVKAITDRLRAAAIKLRTTPPPMSHEERQQLIRRPIVFHVIGGKTHGGLCTGEDIPIEGQRTPLSALEDER